MDNKKLTVKTCTDCPFRHRAKEDDEDFCLLDEERRTVFEFYGKIKADDDKEWCPLKEITVTIKKQ